jgi:hypothetical protein
VCPVSPTPPPRLGGRPTCGFGWSSIYPHSAGSGIQRLVQLLIGTKGNVFHSEVVHMIIV